MNDYIRYPVYGKYYKFTLPEGMSSSVKKLHYPYIIDFYNYKAWGKWSGTKYELLTPDECCYTGIFRFDKWLKERWIVEELDEDDLFAELL